jgi:hypothetical protein
MLRIPGSPSPENREVYGESGSIRSEAIDISALRYPQPQAEVSRGRPGQLTAVEAEGSLDVDCVARQNRTTDLLALHGPDEKPLENECDAWRC